MSWISAPLLASSEAFVCSVSEHGDGYVVRAVFHCVTLFDPLLVYDRQLALVGYSRGAPMNADSWGLIPLIILFALPCNKSPGFDQGNVIPGRHSSSYSVPFRPPFVSCQKCARGGCGWLEARCCCGFEHASVCVGRWRGWPVGSGCPFEIQCTPTFGQSSHACACVC
jgi:hypothetical protein